MEKFVPPKKPDNFWLIYFVIVGVSSAIGLVLIYLDEPFAFVYMVIFVPNAPRLWFREYWKEYNEYQRKLHGIRRAKVIPNGPQLIENSEVNKNIRLYREAQKVRRQSAKWWQLWVL